VASGFCDDPLSISNYEVVKQTTTSIESMKAAGFVVFPLERRYAQGLVESAITAISECGSDPSEEDARRVLRALTDWVIDNWYDDLLSPSEV
jgi:hypothetical protein